LCSLEGFLTVCFVGLFFLIVEVMREVLSLGQAVGYSVTGERTLKGGVAKALLTVRSIAVSLIAEV